MIDDAKRKGLWVMAEDTQADAAVRATGMSSALPGVAGVAGTMISVAAPFLAGTSSAPKGSFSFSPEELDAIIAEWEDLRSALLDDERRAGYMTNIDPPGKEFASGDFTKRANPSGESFLEAIQGMIKYVDKYIEALKDARESISTQDEQAQSDIAKTGEIQ
ncbi:hypothetical protein [Saccharomonospora iraqiensis]|uniref:hypothetical protein n=1 Tax=Saccharomonospora iraqiensis TaxID=52698 RepID=UPI001F46EA2A|nr:hypothetical protein [Saccharomonospora iraqiensis]